MTRERAKKIIGNRPKWERAAMARALQFHAWNNCPKQWQRLAALRALGHKVRVAIPPEYAD